VGERFSTPVRTGSELHPASYTRDTVSFPGIKRPERGVDHPPSSSAEVKEKVELYVYSLRDIRDLFWGEILYNYSIYTMFTQGMFEYALYVIKTYIK